MIVDIARASSFMATHGRVLDRLRFDLVAGRGDSSATRHALNAYRNRDGGYGRAIEPDLRAQESQPAGAMHAFEVMAEIAPTAAQEAGALCDWLGAATLEDGGLPFALRVSDPAGCAPFWAEADASTSSLQITAAVTAFAHRVAGQDDRVANHPWLMRATGFCMERIDAMKEAGHALELLFCLRFLDAAHEAEPDAGAQLERLGSFLPADGFLHVGAGLEEEFVRPLDFAPDPDRPARALFSEEVTARELDRLEGLQQADGGWPCDFASYSPAAALEWRGYLSVEAVTILNNNGRL